MTIEQLDFSIKNSKNILLVSHINPDGDTLGSMCAMHNLILDNYKKKSDMVIVSKLPSVYEFLPDILSAKYIEDVDLSREYDLVINLDVASEDRCANAKVLFDKAKNTVNIDHHETNNSYANINIISGDTGNLLILAESALWAKNGKEACDYANKALEIDAVNCKAWLIKMKATALLDERAGNLAQEIISCGISAMSYAEQENSLQVTDEVYTFYLNAAWSFLLKIIR